MKRTILAGAVLAVTACSGGGAAVTAPSQHADAGNVRVCEHYRAQRAYILGKATPTTDDALKFIGWVAADQAQATPGTALARDLTRMAAAQRNDGPVYAASTRVLNDCKALRVKFTR